MEERKAIFFDRDNTLIKDDGYFHDPDAVILMPHAVKALQKLRDAGFIFVAITNQSGIGRGYFPESDTIAVHKKITELFAGQGIRIEKIYYCPHAPEGNCECRKPKPFLILKAAGEFGIDLAKSFFIGDHSKDMQAGAAAGTRTVIIAPQAKTVPVRADATIVVADITAANLDEAAEKIISYGTLYDTV